ncbi:arginine N-succinyltransferase [Ferrimonas lipolytica]|uniref:Arginine N-succinyltransferase n=1 Tax=Ferrimonas lipolytica TaxID=2724191 RepID=A0A6H1UFF6_9GAMM|nr:arginine N-succinyltransferase [Ferrimonas lipolytica]QIZ77837.1 arginine N-succinyltransferase [Ferrimonas lipolytica]
MLVIRPIQNEDYPELMAIAVASGHGFTSLPVDESLLRKKIEVSVNSFANTITQPGGESYLMVLEDDGKVVGTCAIAAAVGHDDAFYHYRLGKDVHVSDKLNIRREVETLTLCNDYTGASELCTLFLREEHRHSNIGRFLSRSRFLMMAAFPERFSDTVIAEMRGVSDEHGESPFWQWLEQHFFGIDFPTADYLTGIGEKSFVAELMPRHPVYVNLLSEAAQQVVGKVHTNTAPALSLLKHEGFTFRNYVDIFDAGPTVECQRQQIRSVQLSEPRHCHTAEEAELSGDYIVSNGRINNYRVVRAAAQLTESHGVGLSQQVLDALQINCGDPIWLLPL